MPRVAVGPSSTLLGQAAERGRLVSGASYTQVRREARGEATLASGGQGASLVGVRRAGRPRSLWGRLRSPPEPTGRCVCTPLGTHTLQSTGCCWLPQRGPENASASPTVCPSSTAIWPCPSCWRSRSTRLRHRETPPLVPLHPTNSFRTLSLNACAARWRWCAPIEPEA